MVRVQAQDLPEEAANLLLAMAEASAFAGGMRTEGFYIPSETKDLKYLLEKQFVVKVPEQEDKYMVSTRGSGLFKLFQTVAMPKTIVEHAQTLQDKDVPISDRSAIELILILKAAGWEEVPSGQIVAYTPSSPKRFAIEKQGLHHVYLEVLLRAEECFTKGLPSVFHAQIKKYYQCILKLLNEGSEKLKDLRPHLSLKNYVKMMQTSGSKRKAPAIKDTKQNTLQLEDLECDTNLSGQPQLAFFHAVASCW